MTESKNKLRLDKISEQTREPLRLFAEKLRELLRENIKSITVVGSSLTEDFTAGQSDINTVLILDKRTLDTLNTIAGLSKPMKKKKISAPLLMTAEYIDRSQDVFGIEFLDFQLIHQTIFGPDPFSELSFDKKDVRLQCERELKATLIRLRQGYIASGGRKRLIKDILISTNKSMVPILRAMLWLKDSERPNTTEKTIKKAASKFSVDMDSLITIDNWRYEKHHLAGVEMQNIFESIYKIVEQLSLVVDKLEV
jgi:hypothetical protein